MHVVRARLELKTSLILLGTITKRRRRYPQIQIKIVVATFITGIRDHLPFIRTWLKVGDRLPSITFDSCLVISPDFQKIKRETCVGVGPNEL
jgi:hypothetical protein